MLLVGRPFFLWQAAGAAHADIASAEESSSSLADIQAQLLSIVDDLRDINLPCPRGSAESVEEWKSYLQQAETAEVNPRHMSPHPLAPVS